MARGPKYPMIGTCDACGGTNKALVKYVRKGVTKLICTTCIGDTVAIDRAMDELPENEESLTTLRKYVRK